jgi:hypothetical protein
MICIDLKLSDSQSYGAAGAHEREIRLPRQAEVALAVSGRNPGCRRVSARCDLCPPCSNTKIHAHAAAGVTAGVQDAAPLALFKGENACPN